MYLTLEVAVYSIGLSMYKGGVCAVFFEREASSLAASWSQRECQRRERGSQLRFRWGVELEGKILERPELLHEELLLVGAHEFGSFLVEGAVERGQEDLGLEALTFCSRV